MGLPRAGLRQSQRSHRNHGVETATSLATTTQCGESNPVAQLNHAPDTRTMLHPASRERKNARDYRDWCGDLKSSDRLRTLGNFGGLELATWPYELFAHGQARCTVHLHNIVARNGMKFWFPLDWLLPHQPSLLSLTGEGVLLFVCVFGFYPCFFF